MQFVIQSQSHLPIGKRQFPKEITAGQTIMFGSMEVEKENNKRTINRIRVEPSTLLEAGTPSKVTKVTSIYKPISSYGHI